MTTATLAADAFFFAFSGRSLEYHHGRLAGSTVAAVCGEGNRIAKGTPRWTNRDDIPTRMEECQACARRTGDPPPASESPTTASERDGTTDELGACVICGLEVHGFPDGERQHYNLDGSFTLKGRGGCKRPKPKPRWPSPSDVAFRVERRAAEVPDKPAASRAAVQEPAARAPPSQGHAPPPEPAAPPAVEKCPHGVPIESDEPCPSCDEAAGVTPRPASVLPPEPPCPPVGSLDWMKWTAKHGLRLMEQEIDRCDWHEAAKTAEVVLFVVQRARERPTPKGT